MQGSFNWNINKDEQLKQERGVSFSDVVQAVEDDKVLNDRPHPNTEKYAHQRLLTVNINNYAYVVPYVIEADGKLFLKTVCPSRVATKQYMS